MGSTRIAAPKKARQARLSVCSPGTAPPRPSRILNSAFDKKRAEALCRSLPAF